MTETEWLECADPQKMLEFLQGNVSERKLRLFACACSRREESALCSIGFQAIAIAEGMADGQSNKALRDQTEKAIQRLIPNDGTWSMYSIVCWALHIPKGRSYPLEDIMPYLVGNLVQAGCMSAEKFLSAIHEICGNPFRPLSFNPNWQTSTVQQLAAAIYQEKAFDRLPILADALEDAGCDSTDLLNHLRQPGEHVRGCWALDLVLGEK
jgi:hypothetical protein